MAKHLTAKTVRRKLQSGRSISDDAFRILQFLCQQANQEPTSEITLELILLALERRRAFGEQGDILDALVRTVGLYPYADRDQLDTRDLLAYEFHRPIGMRDELVFHRVQADVYRRLLAGENVILSAPTSFGKSLIIDAMIASGRYANLAVIVPTIALIDETRRRLSVYRDYKIITHGSQSLAKRNVFVLTQERLNSFERIPKIDFFVIDEFYKLGTEGDATRRVSLNQAFYNLRKGGGQFYLLGPNIEQLPQGIEDEYECAFIKTNFVTVVSEQVRMPKGGDPFDVLAELTARLNDPTLIFCSSPSKVNQVAHVLIDRIGEPVDEMMSAYAWMSEHYHPQWIFGLALAHGIGLHHGRLPRSLSHYVVRKFNEGVLKTLVCTSTLIEGVNTKAKNVIIFDNTLAKRKLDYFTFNNIRGRSGRMFEHFVGHVYLFHDPPGRELPFVDFPVFTQDEFTPTGLLVQLDEQDLTKLSKERITNIIEQDELPLEVIRSNSALDPNWQLELASELALRPDYYSDHLAWSEFPKYNELKFACELIWKYFVRSKRRLWGVSSGSQLAYKLWRLYGKTTRQLVDEEMRSSRTELTPSESVERVLDFERHWAGYEAPRMLMALSSIQQVVFGNADLPYGDYSFYVALLENVFRGRSAGALDEYGVPLEMSGRLSEEIDLDDDLDSVLSSLKEYIPDRRIYSAFELDVLEDVQSGL